MTIDPQEQHAMPAAEPARERIARRLQDAVEQLRVDMEKVEFWTEVLGSLSRPVPDYNGETKLLNQFELPPQNLSARGSGGSEPMRDLSPKQSAEKAQILAPDRPSNSGRSRH